MTKKIFCIVLCAVLLLSFVPLCASAINLPDEMSLIYNKTTALAPGVVQNKAIAENSAGSRLKVFTAEIDTKEKSLGIAVNYKDNQCNTYGMQVLSKQVAAAERNHSEPYTVVASINASFYDMTNGRPEATFIMDGKVKISGTGGYPFFAVLKDGTPVIGKSSEFETYKSRIYQALTGRYMLVYNGVIQYTTPEHDTYPSTVIGITAEKKVIFMVTDGRQDPVSYGLSKYEMAHMMYSMGCKYAFMFDGGGSATFGSKEPTEESFSIKNSPSDGGERAISTSLLVYSTAVATGEFDHALLDCDKAFLSPGSSIDIDPVGLDSTEHRTAMPQSGLSWRLSDNSKGTINSDGVFTAARNSSGNVTVYLDHNGSNVGSVDLRIVIPEEVKFSKKKMSVLFEERFLLPILATYNGLPVAFNEEDFYAVNQFGYDGSVPEDEIDDYGYFDGLYYVAPPEDKGLKSEVLYMVSAYTESEDDICTLTLDLHNADDAYFDFENATYKDDKMAYYRTVSNTETSDDYNYSIINENQSVIAQYRCGIAMDEMALPDDVAVLWDAFSGVLGDSIWEAFLKVAKKIDPRSCVKVTLALDNKLRLIDKNNITIENDLFLINPNDISYDIDTNTAELIFRWNVEEINRLAKTEEGISSATVSPTVVVNGIKGVLDKDCDDVDGKISISNNMIISYDLIMLSDTAYGTARNNDDLCQFAYENGDERGIHFSADYEDIIENYNIFRPQEAPDGWNGNTYIVDGEPVTGINYLPSKEDENVSLYYNFDESGECLGVYTGIIKQGGKIQYAQNGELAFAGVVCDGGDYYYIDQSLEAAAGENIYISAAKTNGLIDDGYYSTLGDARLIVTENYEGLIAFEEYAETSGDVFGGALVTTGHVAGYYSDGTLTYKTVVKYGDTDCDGLCDARDAVIAACIANGLLDQIPAAQTAAADFNRDGTTDEDDYNIMCSYGLMMV